MVDDLPSGSRRGRRVGTLVFLAAIILAAVVTIVESWPWRQPNLEPLSRAAGDPSSWSGSGQERIANYVGEAACLECHPGESALQARSGHDRTLRRAEQSPIVAWLNGRSVSDPEDPDVRWSYHVRDKRLLVERTIAGRTGSLALDFALGSGKHGLTFVAIPGGEPELDPSGVEHRLSYLANSPRLAITPGQEGSPRQQHHGDFAHSIGFGRLLGPAKLQQCFGCHATLTSTFARNQLETATLLPNVSCERCHGPGRDHVDAARTGQTDLSMRMGHNRVQPWVEVNLCGECHRLPKSISMSTVNPDNPGIVRFQGVGVSMSACYAKGLGGLRCTTCHDPHDRASSDHAHYEAACLSCHRAAEAQKACPISPAANCIGCHMPRRDIAGNGAFTDHWIRKPGPRARESANPPKVEPATTSSQRVVARSAASSSLASRSARVPAGD
jgi:Cytochrome c554 and c-prime